MLEMFNDRYAIYNSDCYGLMSNMPDNSVDFQIYSPPFATLYIYSDDLRDLGNCQNYEQFFEQYDPIIKESLRILRAGRLAAVHCKQIAKYKNSSGAAGWYDFRGEIIRHYEQAGFQYHSEVVIWTDPVLEMQKTKTQRLLYCNLRKDASVSGLGMPEYLCIFRKWDESCEDKKIPVEHYKDEKECEKRNGDARNIMDLEEWRKFASPVWFDIKRTDVLNGRIAREDTDEKHICPLQLEVIRRAIKLWTNPNEIVFSPFMGIGSEGYVSLEQGRRFIGSELKTAYYQQAERNLKMIYNEQNAPSLFEDMEE